MPASSLHSNTGEVVIPTEIRIKYKYPSERSYTFRNCYEPSVFTIKLKTILSYPILEIYKTIDKCLNKTKKRVNLLLIGYLNVTGIF